MTSTATDAGPLRTGQDDAEHARAEYRRLFHRYLAAWATDVLALRRTGLDRPCVRDAWSPAAPMRRAA